MAKIGFNAAAIQPAAPMGVLTPGTYRAEITNTEVKATKAGTGSYLSVEFTINDGPARSRKLWGNYNLENPNPKAVEIAERELSALCHAVGKTAMVDDSDELLGLSVSLAVGIDKNDAERNKITGYMPATAATAAPRPGSAPLPKATLPPAGMPSFMKQAARV
jgi:hypothetical protein